MSLTAIERVFEHAKDTSGTELAVLLALAHMANEDGMCWPGVKRLASMANVSVRSVQVVLRQLKDKGHLLISAKVVRKYRTHAYLVRCGLTEDELAACMTPIFAEDADQMRQANATTLFGAVIGDAFGAMGEESCTHLKDVARRWVQPASPISDQWVQNTAPISDRGHAMGEESCTLLQDETAQWVKNPAPISDENGKMGESGCTHLDQNDAMGEESCTLLNIIITDSINQESKIIIKPDEKTKTAEIGEAQQRRKQRRSALFQAGIRLKALSELSERTWLTAELIRHEEARLRKEVRNYNPGMLIKVLECIEEGDADAFEAAQRNLYAPEAAGDEGDDGENGEEAETADDTIRRFRERLDALGEFGLLPGNHHAERSAWREDISVDVIQAFGRYLRLRDGERFDPREYLAALDAYKPGDAIPDERIFSLAHDGNI